VGDLAQCGGGGHSQVGICGAGVTLGLSWAARRRRRCVGKVWWARHPSSLCLPLSARLSMGGWALSARLSMGGWMALALSRGWLASAGGGWVGGSPEVLRSVGVPGFGYGVREVLRSVGVPGFGYGVQQRTLKGAKFSVRLTGVFFPAEFWASPYAQNCSRKKLPLIEKRFFSSRNFGHHKLFPL
jgi:hypothetical protein